MSQGRPVPCCVTSSTPPAAGHASCVRPPWSCRAQSATSVDAAAGATILGSGLGRDSALATRTEKRAGSAYATFEERGFGAFRSYYDYLPKGRHVVEYTVRLNNPGRFALPPTRVEAMYAPETFGEAPNASIEVAP